MLDIERIKEHHRRLQEANRLTAESQRLNEENEKKSQAELEAIFQQMVENRRKEKEELARKQAEHEAKVLRLTDEFVTKLKNDPSTVVEALESEVINLELVQLAVADAITQSDLACELVIKSPEHLWSKSFIIMKAIILKVTYNKTLAGMIAQVFPPDHLLIVMLNKVGR
jgi:hypothetical protein